MKATGTLDGRPRRGGFRLIQRAVGSVLAGTTVVMLLVNCRGNPSDTRTADPPAEVATQARPAVSPSGEYLLVVVSGYDGEGHFQSFQILNRDHAASQDQTSSRIGETVYASIERFAAHHTTIFLWDHDDRVWVYSGDTGTFFWEQDPAGGTWEKHVYVACDVPAPAFLKGVRPDHHPE